jgi:hypothetical protein
MSTALAALSLLASLPLAAPVDAELAPTDEGRPPAYGFSISAGPYQPSVNNPALPGLVSPHDFYKTVYASTNNKSMFKFRPLMWRFEGSYYLVRNFGLFGPYAYIGFWSTSAPTRICHTDTTNPDSATKQCTPESITTSVPGTDTTILKVIPAGVGLVYRMDLLKRDFDIPLVPYVRGGFDYYYWRNTVGDMTSKRANFPGSAGSWGLQGTGGLAINLDWLDPTSAHRARGSIGLADTALFVEASYLWATSFGNTKRLDVSAWLYSAGLALDFL